MYSSYTVLHVWLCERWHCTCTHTTYCSCVQCCLSAVATLSAPLEVRPVRSSLVHTQHRQHSCTHTHWSSCTLLVQTHILYAQYLLFIIVLLVLYVRYGVQHVVNIMLYMKWLLVVVSVWVVYVLTPDPSAAHTGVTNQWPGPHIHHHQTGSSPDWMEGRQGAVQHTVTYITLQWSSFSTATNVSLQTFTLFIMVYLTMC